MAKGLAPTFRRLRSKDLNAHARAQRLGGTESLKPSIALLLDKYTVYLSACMKK